MVLVPNWFMPCKKFLRLASVLRLCTTTLNNILPFLLQGANVPVDFESYFLSEVNPVLSAKLEDVVASIQKNKVCIKVCYSIHSNLELTMNRCARQIYLRNYNGI